MPTTYRVNISMNEYQYKFSKRVVDDKGKRISRSRQVLDGLALIYDYYEATGKWPDVTKFILVERGGEA